MKLAIISAFFLFLAAVPASAIVTLGLRNQSFGLVGIGGNASGEGESTVTWGSCAFDGTNTNCTLSGPFSGFGAGGTYAVAVNQVPHPLGGYRLKIILCKTAAVFFRRAIRPCKVVFLDVIFCVGKTRHKFAVYTFRRAAGVIEMQMCEQHVRYVLRAQVMLGERVLEHVLGKS